jgi:pimeloyl-ACP methyl ester carboxylesterase
MPINLEVDYGQSTLSAGIRSRRIDNGNGLSMHVLEAGDPTAPCVLFLHGFPELAYSWRKILLPIAELGYHVVAPDQRGYGLTTGWDGNYDDDLRPFGIQNLVRDTIGLLLGLGHKEVAAVVGHDFGSPVAAWCSLIRPDIFRSVVLMSSPFGGAAALAPPSESRPPSTSIHDDLSELTPPRKHYQWYYSTREADGDMLNCPQGVHDFLRAYYHAKSADRSENCPHALSSWTASELAKLPTYYVMNQAEDMAQTVAPEMPPSPQVSDCGWLSEEALSVYSNTFTSTGFQGGLQWYRCATGGESARDLQTFAGKTIDVPSCYVAGKQDWGTFQKPGNLEAMQTTSCSRFQGTHLIENSGHWVQQEQPDNVSRLLSEFLNENRESTK